jgi:hypothetical protein
MDDNDAPAETATESSGAASRPMRDTRFNGLRVPGQGVQRVRPGAGRTSRRDVTQQLSETFPGDYDPLTGQTFHSSPQDEIPDANERLATLIAAPPTSR